MKAYYFQDSMHRILKYVICAALGLAVVQQVSGFTVSGPYETWQVQALDYQIRYWYGNETELGGPKNFDEGSRLNVPILTYAFDSTFLDFFGSDGVAAVDAAMSELNGLPSASDARLS